MEFITEYGLFLAKAVTIVAAILFIVGGVVAVGGRNKKPGEGHLEVKKLNDHLKDVKETLESFVLSKEQLKEQNKEEKKKAKEKAKEEKAKGHKVADHTDEKKVFVIDFDGDIRASETKNLKEAITAILTIATPGKDEVVIRLESGGGMVHSYGHASAQLNRIKNKGIKLTACVDKVAASGGYMMACVADQIVASPFAILGSIGVVAQLPNFHRLLKKNDIDFEVLTAGEHKRTLTVFGENTDKGREKFVHDLEDTHELFKTFVRDHRPVVDIAKVANGDVWFGKRALDVKLIDDIKTSDEYLIERCDDHTVYEVAYVEHKSIQEKLGLAASAGIEKATLSLFSKVTETRYPQ